MAFSESLKKRVRRKAHFRCCLCQGVLVEVHHILPEGEGGSDDEENAAPLCPSCHEIFGANPTKRKFIEEARDWWYETCASRYAPQTDALADVVEAVLREQLAQVLSSRAMYPAGGEGALAALTNLSDAVRADAALTDLHEDTRRWLTDRSDRLVVASRATTTQMGARGSLYSGAHIAALAGLKRQALQEYRDEISLKRRQYRHLRAEWPSVRRYELSEADREILAEWRAPASHPTVVGFTVEIDDVTSEDREPDLRRFEREGDPPLGDVPPPV